MENQPHVPIRPDIPTPEEAMMQAAAEPAVTRAGGEAGLGTRIGGFLIDVLVALALAVVIGRISEPLGSLVGAAYLLTRDSLPFLNGESLGKKAVKIKAVTESGATLSGNWAPGLVRNAVLLIPFFALVELIVLIVRSGKPGGLRRLGDEWAKTKVVTVS